MMETTFYRWLKQRGTAIHVFAREHDLPRGSVYKLAGVSAAEAVKQVPMTVALKVARITGIGFERLVREADVSRASPIPPRKYSRRSVDAAE